MQKRARAGRLVIRTLIPAALAAAMVSMTALAAGPERGNQDPIPELSGVSVPLDRVIELTVSGRKIPSDASYDITLEREDEKTPMPEEAGDRSPYTVTMTKAGAVDFGEIIFESPGDYAYRITQTTEDRNRFTFDRSVYRMAVKILRSQDGGKDFLTYKIGIQKEGDAEKTDRAVFENSYHKPGGGGGHDPGGGGGTRPGKPKTSSPGPEPEDGLTPELSVIPAIPGILPKTGDTTRTGLWIALTALSGTALLVSIVLGRRRDGAKT